MPSFPFIRIVVFYLTAAIKPFYFWQYEKEREKNDIEKYIQNELCYV